MLPRFGNLGGDHSNFRAGFGQDADLITSSHLKNLSAVPQGIVGKESSPGPYACSSPTGHT